jgi:hypothetical protein
LYPLVDKSQLRRRSMTRAGRHGKTRTRMAVYCMTPIFSSLPAAGLDNSDLGGPEAYPT